MESQKNYPMVFEFLKNTKLNLEIDVYGSGELLDELKTIKMNKNLKINFLGNKKILIFKKNIKNISIFYQHQFLKEIKDNIRSSKQWLYCFELLI